MAGSDLVVSVGANIQQLERQLKASAKLAEQAADDIEKKFQKANPSISTSALTGALKGFAAAFTLDKVIRGLADANAELVRIGDTAKRVGLDLQRFQELQFAGRSNGLSSKDFGTGLEGLAEKLNEARQKENDLSSLFDDNNLKLKNRKGEVIGINDALGKVAGLVQNAATEFDKIKIAEAVGLSREWVPLLEQGAAAIDRQAAAAQSAGAVIDAEIIQKAKDFERDWASALQRWTALFQSNAGVIISLIDTIISKAGGLASAVNKTLGNYSRRVSANEDLRNNGVGGASLDTLRYVREEGTASGLVMDRFAKRRLAELEEQDRENRRGGGFASIEKKKPEAASGARTDTSSLFPEKKGAKGAKSEEEQAQDRLDRYIETLMRQNSVLDAEIATFGKSNAEKRAAVELAKAQVDLAKLDEGERQKIIASLTKEIELSEQKRTKLESLKSAQQGLTDAQKYFGNAAVDALEDLIINGAKAEDVVKRLAASLAKAALQALLIGDGPLAGLFGTKGVGGATGGLFGMLGTSIFGKATGGPVNAGQAYDVGERGKERFVPTVPGRIIPNNRLGGSISYTDGRTINITPAAGVTPQQLLTALAIERRQSQQALMTTLRTQDNRMAR